MPAAVGPELARAGGPTMSPTLHSELPALPDVHDDKVALHLGEPGEELKDYARKILGETEETKTRSLQELKDIIYGATPVCLSVFLSDPRAPLNFFCFFQSAGR